MSNIDDLYISRIKAEKSITQSKAYDREFQHTKLKLKRNRQSLSLLTVADVKNIPIRLLEFNQIWMLRAPDLMTLKSNKPSFLNRKKRAGGVRMRWKSSFEELNVNEMRWRKRSRICNRKRKTDFEHLGTVCQSLWSAFLKKTAGVDVHLLVRSVDISSWNGPSLRMSWSRPSVVY